MKQQRYHAKVLLHVLVVCVAEVVQVEVLHGQSLLLLLAVGPGLLETLQLLVMVLAQRCGLLAHLGLGLLLLGLGLVLVGLAEGVGRQPLVKGQFAGVERHTLSDGRGT